MAWSDRDGPSHWPGGFKVARPETQACHCDGHGFKGRPSGDHHLSTSVISGPRDSDHQPASDSETRDTDSEIPVRRPNGGPTEGTYLPRKRNRNVSVMKAIR